MISVIKDPTIGLAAPSRTPGRTAVALLIAAVLWAAPGAGHAQEGPSVWHYSFYKTLTYEALANAADFALYSTVLGGTAASALPFLAANAASAASAYYVHEVAWNFFAPAPGTTTEALERGLAKTLTYRVVSTAQHMAVAYAFTGNPWAAASYALATNLSDVVVYLANEYGWDAFGPPLPRSTAAPTGAAGP
jgi:uncharacterized membrane protein